MSHDTIESHLKTRKSPDVLRLKWVGSYDSFASEAMKNMWFRHILTLVHLLLTYDPLGSQYLSEWIGCELQDNKRWWEKYDSIKVKIADKIYVIWQAFFAFKLQL